MGTAKFDVKFALRLVTRKREGVSGYCTCVQEYHSRGVGLPILLPWSTIALATFIAHGAHELPQFILGAREVLALAC